MINGRGKNIHQEDRQENSFRVSRVKDPDHDRNKANKKTVDPFPAVGLGSGNGIRCHIDDSESKASHNEVLPEIKAHQSIKPAAFAYPSLVYHAIEDQAHYQGAQNGTEHNTPAGNLAKDQE